MNSQIQRISWWFPEAGGRGWAKMGEGCQKVQTFSNKIK